MVTVSAVIFLAGTRTMVITTKIKELQYFNKYNEIFILSLLILFTNMIAKLVFQKLAQRSQRKENLVDMKKIRKMGLKRVAAVALAAVTGMTALGMTGCGGGAAAEDQVIIYSNADDEAVEAMKHTLDDNGYEASTCSRPSVPLSLAASCWQRGRILRRSMVTMSTFYVESAQEQNSMFQDLTFDVNTLDEFEAYCAPITSQEELSS